MQKYLTCLLTLLLLAGLIKAIYYTNKFGGADLRDRIVGARLLHTPHSPYYYKWKPGDPEELINPNIVQTRNISGITAAPGTLYLLYPLSTLHYPVIRFAWLALQYVFLGYIFLFFLRRQTSLNTKLLVAAVGVLFFFCSPFWLLHIDRGQVYIYYAFLFCLVFQAYRSDKPWMQFAAGWLIVWAIYSRPIFAALVFPLLFTNRRPVFNGLLAGGALAALCLVFNFQLWKDYFISMFAFTTVTDQLHFDPSSRVNFPDVIEGMTNLRMGKLDFQCGGLMPLNVRLERLLMPLPGKAYIVIYAAVVATIMYVFRRRLRQKSATLFALFGFLFYMLAEYIMPAPRGAYSLVQWVFPVLLMLMARRMTMLDQVIMITGLCFTVNFPFAFPYFNDIGELLLVYTVVNFIRKYEVFPKETTGNNRLAGY